MIPKDYPTVSYPEVPLNREIEINSIITLFYFEYAKDYVFHGEAHNFWEFLYVDKGKAEVMADAEGYELEQGEMIFHKPNEFHSIWADGKTAPNLIVVSFICRSPAMKFFENKILKVDQEGKDLLAKIIRERSDCFSDPLDKRVHADRIRPDRPFASQQLISLYLEMLLITLIRNNTAIENSARVSSSTRHRVEEDLVNRIIAYMNENLDKNLSIDDFCRKFCLGRTRIKDLFKEKVGISIIQHYRYLKIERAKQLIREERYNFTEVSEMLGFSTIHYFSNVFKKTTGMTPSEYICSVKSKV
ncbi:helix-turn-helix domain-containing protein [Eubacteriales bacterium mix99]|jgi:AraC-like DNA-binding protein